MICERNCNTRLLLFLIFLQRCIHICANDKTEKVFREDSLFHVLACFFLNVKQFKVTGELGLTKIFKLSSIN